MDVPGGGDKKWDTIYKHDIDSEGYVPMDLKYLWGNRSYGGADMWVWAVHIFAFQGTQILAKYIICCSDIFSGDGTAGEVRDADVSELSGSGSHNDIL